MVEGRIFLFFTGILVCGAILLHIQKAKSGKKYQLRPMPALDAIDEAIGRAVEMGRAVHYTPGVGNLTHEGCPLLCLLPRIFLRISEKSARMGGFCCYYRCR